MRFVIVMMLLKALMKTDTFISNYKEMKAKVTQNLSITNAFISLFYSFRMSFEGIKQYEKRYQFQHRQFLSKQLSE